MDGAIDKKTRIMEKEKVSKAIMKLAMPAIVSMVVMAIYNMADTYFVSVVSEGDLEVAAVSVFMPIMLIVQSVAVLFASGGAAYLSRLLGARDIAKAGQTASITIGLAFFFGLILMIVGVVFARPILFGFGASEATIDFAFDYALVMFLATPVQLTNMAFNNLLRAEGNAVRSMVGMVTGAGLNMILDPVFISGVGLGVMGAAIATAISQVVAFIILGSNYWRNKTAAKVRFRGLKLDGFIIRNILKIGVSTFLIQMFSAISFAVINICAKVYGDGTIAALGIVNRLQFMGFAILFGFSQGFQPVAGYNFGARNFERLKTTLIFGITVAMMMGFAITVLYRIFAPQLIGVFTSDGNVLGIGVDTLQWFTIAFPITSFSLIVLMTYQVLGKALGALMLAICRQGVCLIPAVLILANILGFRGILISPLVSDSISGVIAVVLAIKVYRFINAEKAKSLNITAEHLTA